MLFIQRWELRAISPTPKERLYCLGWVGGKLFRLKWGQWSYRRVRQLTPNTKGEGHKKKDAGKSKGELNLFAGLCCLVKWGQEGGVQDPPLQNISASQEYFDSQKKSFLLLFSPPDTKISSLKDTPLASTFSLFNCTFLRKMGITLKRREEENLSAP